MRIGTATRTTLLAVAGALVAGAAARAGDLGTITGFDVFAENHPGIAADLARHPSLVHDPDYMRSHPGLVQYLRSTPLARMELDDEADAEIEPTPPAHADQEEEKARQRSMHAHPLVPPNDD